MLFKRDLQLTVIGFLLCAGIKSGQQPLINFKVLAWTTLFERIGWQGIYSSLNVNSAHIKWVHTTQGYLLGNGLADDSLEGINALVPFAFGMGLISSNIYQVCLSSTKDYELNCRTQLETDFTFMTSLTCLSILSIYLTFQAWQGTCNRTYKDEPSANCTDNIMRVYQVRWSIMKCLLSMTVPAVVIKWYRWESPDQIFMFLLRNGMSRM